MGNTYQFRCDNPRCHETFYTNVPIGQAITGDTHEVHLDCPYCHTHDREANNVQAPVGLAVSTSKNRT